MSKLPERASLEYLKKLSKDRLQELRRTDPTAKLAAAQLDVARQHGFSSWRAVKAEIEQRQRNAMAMFFEACARGDVDVMRRLLADDPGIVHTASPTAPHGGWTGLHSAARGGHVEAVQLLLEHGANPNAREVGDNTYPLHWAAAHGQLETVRVLLDAGTDVHGFGDVHEMDVIGWASVFRAPGDEASPLDETRQAILSLLLERGARHHIVSAMFVGDPDLIRTVVEENPDALDRRMSRFEHGLTPLHVAIDRRRYDLLDLLIELGADLEAVDGRGHTALEMAMLRGDRDAMRRLSAAGAKQPRAIGSADLTSSMQRMADSVKKGVPMIYVPDVARALEWYASIGFRELARYEGDGLVNFGMVSFGKAELMINMGGAPGKQTVSLWFYTNQVDNLYQTLKSRQLDAARAALAGQSGDHRSIEFEQDIEDMFYGARQFCIRDPNGYELYFIQDK